MPGGIIMTCCCSCVAVCVCVCVHSTVYLWELSFWFRFMHGVVHVVYVWCMCVCVVRGVCVVRLQSAWRL